jgi:hypothetical protein
MSQRSNLNNQQSNLNNQQSNLKNQHNNLKSRRSNLKYNNTTDLIELSDHEDDFANIINLNINSTPSIKSINSSESSDYTYSASSESVESCGASTSSDSMGNNIVLIQKENITVDDAEVMHFIEFCVDKRLFDSTFYDYGNAFSIMATKLPMTFEQMTLDGESIEKNAFINFFKHTNYDGDVEYIYNYIKKKDDEHIIWEELLDFFLPFIKYITF